MSDEESFSCQREVQVIGRLRMGQGLRLGELPQDPFAFAVDEGGRFGTTDMSGMSDRYLAVRRYTYAHMAGSGRDAEMVACRQLAGSNR